MSWSVLSGFYGVNLCFSWEEPKQWTIVVHTLTKSQHVCSQMVKFSLELLSFTLRYVLYVLYWNIVVVRGCKPTPVVIFPRRRGEEQSPPEICRQHFFR